MIITDKEVLKEIKRVRSGVLWESINAYPDDERDGRSDMEFFADEVSYMISCIHENGHSWCDDAEWAREVLRETKNGKVMPLWPESLQPIYRQSDIQIARDIINENRRLENCLKRLNKNGYYGKWQ